MPPAKTATEPRYDADKFRELILYVSARLAGDPSNGSVKSNKVMFFSDFFHYQGTGEPITGVQYVHHRLGPAPKGLTEIQQALIESDQAEQVITYSGPQAQKMLFPKREPDLSKFSAAEISTVEKVLDALKNRTGVEVSELSHALLAWQLTEEREPIPYSWALMYDGPVPDETFDFAETLAKEIRERKSAGAS